MASLAASVASATPSMARAARVPSSRSVAAPLVTLRPPSAPRRSVAVLASGIESIPGFGGGGLKGGMSIRSSSKQILPEDVVLESECGADYEPLKAALAEGDFQKADDITRALLIELAGEAAKERGWVYFTEIKNISVKDFKSMDDLWRAYSDGKFGFSVQRQLWVQNKMRWPKFFKQINWVQGENNIYRKWPGEFMYTKEAVKGHLPLTNALRGTELIIAIFNHPAFIPAEKKRPKVGQSGFDSTSL